MGSNASIATDRPQFYSDEVRICKVCENDLDVSFCKECDMNICKTCCKHFAKQKNRFYFSSLVPVFTDVLRLDHGQVKKQNIRCGTIGPNRKFVFLQQILYKDRSFEWRLRFSHGTRQLCVAKRQPNENKSFAFPGDVCFVENKNKLFVTIPCKKMVYSLYKDENFQEAFSTPLGSCFGITSFNNGFALSVQTSAAFLNSKWQVQFLDMKGNVLHRIQNNSEGQAYFEEPLNLTSNKTGNVLFVSDKGKNTVFAFDVTGKLIYCYHGMVVRSPLGIAVDRLDNVYVACGKKIVQIENGGKKSRELPFDIKGKIVSLCMDDSSDTLTAMSESGHIASFDFY